MKKYTQLSQDERYEIYATLKSKSSIASLARELGRSRSTIYRELKRNTGQRGYRAQQAAKFASQRRYRPSSSMTALAFAYIDYLIGLDWSPEQISGALTQHGWLDITDKENKYFCITIEELMNKGLLDKKAESTKFKKSDFVLVKKNKVTNVNF
jgi:IS30 family transposase